MIGKEVGGYLTNLENEYELIAKRQPLFEKSATKNVRYELGDVFYSFWFRFIFKYSYIIDLRFGEPGRSLSGRRRCPS